MLAMPTALSYLFFTVVNYVFTKSDFCAVIWIEHFAIAALFERTSVHFSRWKPISRHDISPDGEDTIVKISRRIPRGPAPD